MELKSREDDERTVIQYAIDKNKLPEKRNPSTAKDKIFVTDDPEQPLDENILRQWSEGVSN